VGQTEDGKVYHKLWSADAIDQLLKDNDLAKPQDSEES
jgi:20S proteasome subunit alpha 3